MTTSEFAIALSDRRQNAESARCHVSTMRWLRESGSSIRSIANVFGKSYEWTRRIVKDVAYDYVNDAEVGIELTDAGVEVVAA